MFIIKSLLRALSAALDTDTPASQKASPVPELLTEEFSELRWRRDIEERLLNWTVVSSSGILGLCALLLTSDRYDLLIPFGVIAGIFIIGLARGIRDKLIAEHKVYVGVCETIKAILQNEHTFVAGGDGKPYIGSSLAKLGVRPEHPDKDGHELTLAIFNWCWRFVATALVAGPSAMWVLKNWECVSRVWCRG